MRFLLKPRTINKKQYIIGSICVLVAFIALLVPSIILMSNGTAEAKLVLNQFTWGLILLALAISILFGLIITIPPLFIKKKQNA